MLSKSVSPANLQKIADIFATYKTNLAGDSLDPKIYKNAIIFEARSYLTHSSKTWVIACVDPARAADFMS